MASSTTTPIKAFANKLEAKIKAKLEKAKGKLHKLKPSKKASKAINPADTETNMAVFKPNVTNDNMVAIKLDKIHVNPSTITIVQPTSAKHNMAIIKPTATADNAAIVKPGDVALTKPDIKAVIEPADAENSVAEPNNTKAQGQLITSEPKHARDEGQVRSQSPGSAAATKAQAKAAKRAARRQARKEKWATRRAAIKVRAKKIGEALFIPAAVISGLILGPVILAVGIVFFVVTVVVLLVVQTLDLICCCPVLACFLASDLKSSTPATGNETPLRHQ